MDCCFMDVTEDMVDTTRTISVVAIMDTVTRSCIFLSNFHRLIFSIHFFIRVTALLLFSNFYHTMSHSHTAILINWKKRYCTLRVQ